MVDVLQPGPSKEPTSGTPCPTEPSGSPVTAFGQPCEAFYALISGNAGALVTKEGTGSFTRVYFEDGVFDLGEGKGRAIAGQRVEQVVLDSLGMWLSFTRGHKAFVPLETLKPSWKVPEQS